MKAGARCNLSLQNEDSSESREPSNSRPGYAGLLVEETCKVVIVIASHVLPKVGHDEAISA